MSKILDATANLASSGSLRLIAVKNPHPTSEHKQKVILYVYFDFQPGQQPISISISHFIGDLHTWATVTAAFISKKIHFKFINFSNSKVTNNMPLNCCRSNVKLSDYTGCWLMGFC